MGIATRLLRIRAGEAPLALVLVAVMLLTSVGQGIGGTASDALLFARYGTGALPQLYLALGIVSFVCALCVSAVFGRVRRERVYPAALVALALLLLAVRGVLGVGGDAAYPVMWLAANVVGMLQGIVAWGVASWLCDARQAKRLFPVANAAKILGTIAGTASVGAFLLVARLEDLLIVWAVALAATLLVVLRIRGRSTAAPPPTNALPLHEELLVGFRIVRGSSLLRWLAVSLVLFSVLFFSLALPFTRAARAAMPDERELAAFLGIFNATTTAAAFLASLFLAQRFYARFGVVNAILVFTLIYLAGFATLVLTGSFLAIVAIRWVQMAWLAGMADAAYQALFNPAPAERRDQMRAFMEGVPGQAGIALAGVLLITGDRALDPRAVALGGAIAAAATTAVMWRARGAYRDALVAALRSGRPEPFLGAEDSYVRLLEDRATLGAVLAGAGAADLPTRRASMQILADLARADGRDVLLGAARDPDAVVRAHALRGGARVAPRAFVDAARASLDDPDPGVRRASLLVLLRAGTADAGGRLAAAAKGDPGSRLAAVHAAAEAGSPDAPALLETLASDADAEVRKMAGRALVACAPQRAIALGERVLADGGDSDAALALLERAPDAGASAVLRSFAAERRRAALDDAVLSERAAGDSDVGALLRMSLARRSARAARDAVRAAAILSGRLAPAALLDALTSNDTAARADALETLETYVARDLARPLLAIWEPDGRPAGPTPSLETHPDPWIRACAAYLTHSGGDDMATLTTVPLVERVLFLHKVPLFAALDPADLQQVARIATERSFAGGEAVMREGDIGDALYVIAAGSVRVLRDGSEVAMRGAGDSIGEMSLVGHEARNATVIAAGDVRTLRIGRAEFEAMLRDRPETALGVIRVLSARLSELMARVA